MVAEKLVTVEKDVAYLLDPANGFSFDYAGAASCALAKHDLHPSTTFEVVPGHKMTVEQAIFSLFSMRRKTR